MGTRPQMHLVFGIDDFDSDIPVDVETQLYLPDEEIAEGPFELLFLRDTFCHFKTKEWGRICDFLYVGNEWNPGVLGMILTHQMGYKLSIFHKEYESAGKRDLPVWERADYPLYDKRIESKWRTCGDIEFQWSWFYPSVVESHKMWPIRAYCARWLMQQADVKIDYHRFKAMLVWEWS